jgi:hypothetical protein
MWLTPHLAQSWGMLMKFLPPVASCSRIPLLWVISLLSAYSTLRSTENIELGAQLG